MTFKAGKSGNPGGQQKRKLFVDALNIIISAKIEDDEVPRCPKQATVAYKMAHKLVIGAMRDDWKPGESLAYMQEICDRAYGKPKQAIVGGDEEDEPIKHQLISTDQDIINRYLDKMRKK